MSTSLQIQPERSTVQAYLVWDHDEIDSILADVVEMVEDGEWERAAHHYADFADRLAWHIRFEEEDLFPIFERRHGMAGPPMVMRSEHREIERAIVTMQEALEDQDGARFRSGYEDLMQVLPGHNEKEENILYPFLEGIMTTEERTTLLGKVPTR